MKHGQSVTKSFAKNIPQRHKQEQVTKQWKMSNEGSELLKRNYKPLCFS
jgi:hypothetical protein